jgi:hypothetical protein
MTALRSAALLALLSLLAVAVGTATGADVQTPAKPTQPRPPRIDPDYTDVVIPPNLAPLNFRVREPGTEFRVDIGPAGSDERIEILSDTPDIRIPPSAWRRLLAEHAGEEIEFAVQTRGQDGTWDRFQPITIRVARDSIDSYLVYRLLKPVYNKYVHMGIYQRELSSFDESPILDNRHAGNACINCHTFHQNRPDPMLLETRNDRGSPILLARGGDVETIDTRTEFHRSPATYATWHPGGRHVCFSLNNATLFFHTDPRKETREVFDATSELVVYSFDDNMVTTTPEISSEEFAETWPEWSADGRYLYFSSTKVTPIEDYAHVRYDLMRIGYDVDSGEWGELETVVSAAETGLSILQPKVSPDGRFLVCTMADHGNFPIFLASSDLYVVDLQEGGYRRLEINSDEADSWHSWSSNSRWLVFSSKRRDGLFARPYFTYVDEAGHFHRPFLLPQEDPSFYDGFIQTVNVPVLVTGRVEVSQRALAQAIIAPERVKKATLDPRVAVRAPADDSDLPTEPYSSGTP